MTQKKIKRLLRASTCLLLTFLTLAMCCISAYALDPSDSSLTPPANVVDLKDFSPLIYEDFTIEKTQLGKELAFVTFRDVGYDDDNVRVAYNSIFEFKPDLISNDDNWEAVWYYPQFVNNRTYNCSDYIGVRTTSPVDDYSSYWLTFWYEHEFVDSNGNPDYYYDPATQFWYDKMFLSVSVTRNGANCTEDDITAYTSNITADGPESTPTNVYTQVIVPMKEGVYEFTVQYSFQDVGNDNPNNINSFNRPVIFRNRISVLSNEDYYQEVYNKGYNEGYQKGRIDGINSDEEFTVYGLINAVINAPIDFIEGALDFEVFGVNVAGFVKMLFTLLIVAFVVVCVLRAVV